MRQPLQGKSQACFDASTDGAKQASSLSAAERHPAARVKLVDPPQAVVSASRQFSWDAAASPPDEETLGIPEIDDWFRFIGKEFIESLFDAGTLPKLVVVRYEHSPARQAWIKISQAVEGGLIDVHVQVNKGKPHAGWNRLRAIWKKTRVEVRGRDFRQQAFHVLELSLLKIARLVPVDLRADAGHAPVRSECVEKMKLPLPFRKAEQERRAAAVNSQLSYVSWHLGALRAEAPKVICFTHRLDQSPLLLKSIENLEELLVLSDPVVAPASDGKGILRPVAHRFHLQVTKPTINHTGFKQTT